MTTARVVLVNVGKGTHEILAKGVTGLVLEEVSNAAELFDQLEHSRQCPEVLILGAAVDEPVSIAQRAHLFEEDLPVIILSDPKRYAALEKALRFAPFVGTEVRSVSTEVVLELPGYVDSMVARAGKRRRYRRSIKAAQNRLREIGQSPPKVTHYLDRLLDKAPIGVINIDARGRILTMNRRAGTILRLSERETVGSAITDFFPTSEQSSFKEMMAHCVAPARRNPPQVFELSVNGSPLFVEITASSFIDRSGQLGAMVILQDVSSRVSAELQRAQAEGEVRRREEQLRLITDVVPVLIAYIDNDRVYRFNNWAHSEWYGRPLDQITGRPVKDIMPASDYEQLSVYLDQALQGRLVEYDMRLRCVDRSVCHVHGNLVPDIADGAVRGVVNVVSNVTESKKAEEREKQHMLELAHVGRVVTLGELSSHLAHELAQPLTAIGNFADATIRMLDDKACSLDEVHESLADILEQSDRARKIIAQLRNFIRKSELQKSEANINDLVADVVRLERLEARWHDMELELVLSDSLPKVSVDRTLIQQVLLNLIHNGIEAMQDVAGRGTLRIETRYSAGIISVLISDTGPGLGGKIDRVFEPFFTTKGSGMGMGLAIAHSIVEAHGGRLEAKNDDGGGATFCFTLSVQRANR